MATDDYKHDGQVTITLAYDADEISVWPSVEVPGSVGIALLDSQEPRTNIGIASPPECDALIAAIGRALGRPAAASPRYTPSEELRFIEPLCAALAAAGATQEETLDAITKAMQDYRAKAVKLALEQTRPMVVVLDEAAHGEQGATVPRAGVEALRDRLLAVDSGMEDIIIDAFDAILAAPTAQTEKG